MHKGDGTSIDHARVLVPSGEGNAECGCCFGDDEQVGSRIVDYGRLLTSLS